MIFVAVGNATQGFRRLLDAVEGLAQRGGFGTEEVCIQTGNNPGFRSSHCTQTPFLPADRFLEMVRAASLVISHAGAGTLLHVLPAGKPVIVMPRRKRYGELVDDHQIELVRHLAAEGRVIPAFEPDDLPDALAAARARRAAAPPPAPSDMPRLVAQAIRELIGEAR